MNVNYTDSNYTEPDNSLTKICYLCGKDLDNESATPDHLIPNSLFEKGSPKRPKLIVHHSCNNAKSKEDEWFVRQVQLMCGLNPSASSGLSDLLSKAMEQKQDAYIIGRSKKIRDYKLAKSLLDKNTWGLQVQKGSEILPLLHLGKANSERTAVYVKNMCRGLYIRNVRSSTPRIPKLDGIQYAKASLDGSYDNFMKRVNHLMANSTRSGFYQQWTNRVVYGGSRVAEDLNKGFLFVEFYGEVGYLATFT